MKKAQKYSIGFLLSVFTAVNIFGFLFLTASEVSAEDVIYQRITDIRGDKAIAKLYKLDFLNDERFARIWVSDRIKLKPKGKKALKEILKQLSK